MALSYQIKLGDCIFCVIEEHFLLPESVWKHSNNSTLREQRQTMNMLEPGDIVFIPDIKPKEVQEPTNQVHKFRLKAEKHRHWIEIELIGEDDKPVPDKKYKLKLPDGTLKEGNLDEKGWAREETDPSGTCEVSFPELDKDAWEFIKSVGPMPSRI